MSPILSSPVRPSLLLSRRVWDRRRLLRGGVGAARGPPRPNPRRGIPPPPRRTNAPSTRSIRACAARRVRSSPPTFVGDGPTPPNRRIPPPSPPPRSGCVNLSSLASVNSSSLGSPADRPTAPPSPKALLREVGPISATDDASRNRRRRRSREEVPCPAASSSIAHPFSFIGGRPAKRSLYIWRADDEGE